MNGWTLINDWLMVIHDVSWNDHYLKGNYDELGLEMFHIQWLITTIQCVLCWPHKGTYMAIRGEKKGVHKCFRNAAIHKPKKMSCSLAHRYLHKEYDVYSMLLNWWLILLLDGHLIVNVVWRRYLGELLVMIYIYILSRVIDKPTEMLTQDEEANIVWH